MISGSIGGPGDATGMMDLLQRATDDDATRARLKELSAAEAQHGERLRAAEETERSALAEQKKAQDAQTIVQSAMAELAALKEEVAAREAAVQRREDDVAAREEEVSASEQELAGMLDQHERERAAQLQEAADAKREAAATTSAAAAAKAEAERLIAEHSAKLEKLKAIVLE